MLSQRTLQEIEIIKRMDLKVAVPLKFEAPQYITDSETTSVIEAQYIHIPSLISNLIFDAQQARREVEDIKAATRLIFNVTRETTQQQKETE